MSTDGAAQLLRPTIMNSAATTEISFLKIDTSFLSYTP
jgi:hypothetical protein